MSGRVWRFAVVAILAATRLVQAEEPNRKPAKAPEFPLAENMPASEFARQAIEFLRDHPASKFAPRVALDLLAAANAARDESLAHQARVALFLDYPESPQAALALGFYRQPVEYAAFLNKVFDDNVDSPGGLFAYRFSRAIHRGLAHFNQSFGDRSLSLRIVAMTRRHVGHWLRAPARADVAQGDDQAAKVGRIVLDEQITAVEAIERLHAMGGERLARIIERVLFDELPDAVRQEPKLQRLLAENYLSRAKLPEAAAILNEATLAAADAEWLLSRAICAAQLGKADGARQSLDAIETRFAGSPQNDVGRVLLACLEKKTDNEQAFANHVLTLARQIKAGGWNMLEASLAAFNPQTQRTINVYLAYAIDQNLLELQIREEAKLVAAYRCEAQHCQVYIAGEQAILKFPQPVMPVPTASLQVNRDGDFNFNWNVQTGFSLRAAGAANRGLLDSALLSTADGLQTCLASVNRRGWFLESLVSPEDGIRVEWVQASSDPPRVDRAQIEFSPEQRTLAFRSKFFISNLKVRYGEAGELAFAPPAWPALPIAEKSAVDFTFIIRALAAAAELFKNSPATGGK